MNISQEIPPKRNYLTRYTVADDRSSLFLRNEKITSDIQRCERADHLRPLDVLIELDFYDLVIKIKIVVLVVRIVARV